MTCAPSRSYLEELPLSIIQFSIQLCRANSESTFGAIKTFMFLEISKSQSKFQFHRGFRIRSNSHSNGVQFNVNRKYTVTPDLLLSLKRFCAILNVTGETSPAQPAYQSPHAWV